MMTDFMCALLLEKPDDVFSFAKRYFSAFQPEAALDAESHIRPLVVAGPSGVGKGTLISMLLGEFTDAFGFSISHTTRSPRAGLNLSLIQLVSGYS